MPFEGGEVVEALGGLVSGGELGVPVGAVELLERLDEAEGGVLGGGRLAAGADVGDAPLAVVAGVGVEAGEGRAGGPPQRIHERLTDVHGG